MGNTQSVPSVGRQDSKGAEYGRRKLSKPRVGNHGSRRGISCFPQTSIRIGSRVSKAKNEVVQGDLENETTLKSWSAHRRHHSLSYSRHPVSHTKNQPLDRSAYRGAFPKYSSIASQNSIMTSHNTRATGLEQSHPPLSIMRRRSQIFTASTKPPRQPTFTLDGGIPTPQLLALDLADRDRAQTPSGYSVLGVFKRGSLRIVNTTDSPASSTQDVRPRRRHTSPTHANTSIHSPRVVTPMPQLTISPGDNEGYFEKRRMLTVSNPTLNGLSTPGEVYRLEALTTASLEPTPEGVLRSHQASEIHIHILPPPAGLLSTAMSSDNITPSEVPKAGQQMGSSANHTLVQSSAHERHSSLISYKIAGSPDNSQFARSVPSRSSSYSDLSEHRLAMEAKHTQRSSVRCPSVRAKTDSGYYSTGSIKSWKSWSTDDDFHNACTTPSTELDRQISDAKSPEPELKKEQSDTKPQFLQGIQQNEASLKSTDKYRIRAAQEGPIFEDIVLHGRARRPSVQMCDHFLAHKKSITQRLQSVGDLEATRNPSLCLSVDKQQIYVPSPASNIPKPSIDDNRKLGAGSSSSSDRAVVEHKTSHHLKKESPSGILQVTNGIYITPNCITLSLHSDRSPTTLEQTISL